MPHYRSGPRAAGYGRRAQEAFAIAPKFEATFIGSFFELDQLPKDRRPQVALAGRSNVGKSSLLNRLVGRKRLAKVSSTPGKTRSLNFFLANERFYLVDLPGYGYARVSKSIKAGWTKLVGNYLRQSEELLGLLLLLDCRREITDDDRELLDWLVDRSLPVLIVLTKCDKLTRDKLNRKVQAIEKELGLEVLPTSVVSGIGKNELVSAIRELVQSAT